MSEDSTSRWKKQKIKKALLVVHNSFKNLAYLGICLIASSKGMLSFTFLKASKISFSLSSFFNLEELTGKGRIVLKLEFIELGVTFGVVVVVSICGGGGCFFFLLNSVSIYSSSSISICFDLCFSSSFPLRSMIALTFSF